MSKRSTLQLGHPLALAALAAADPSPAQAQSFAVLDVNQDGFIDKKEAGASPFLVKAFDSADTDRDGRLSPPEYAKASTQKP